MQNASGMPQTSEQLGFPFIIPGTSQKLAYTGTSARSSAVGVRTSVVRLLASTDCHVIFGVFGALLTPTAVADGTCVFLKAGIEYHFGITPGAKIAAIQDAAGGNLFITEGA